MADLGLVRQLMDAGADRDTATRQVDAVADAMKAQLAAGKWVTIPGIGRFFAEEQTVRHPEYRAKLRKQRKVKLHKPEIVSKGEPYDNLDYVAPKRSLSIIG